MIAVITGDIVNSGGHETSEWMGALKQCLGKYGETPTDWEIYRGDEFQLRLANEEALFAAITIKAVLKSIKGLDVRMAIGIGTETFVGTGVSESNGQAYRLSGRTFNMLGSQKRNLAVAMDNEEDDLTLNLMLKLALVFMDDWSPVSAEVVTMVLEQPNVSQKELAQRLKIQQSAVSQRLKRAHLDLIFDVLDYYDKMIKETTK